MSEYFTDITLRKQIVVTAFFEFQLIVVDFIFVNSFVLLTITRLLIQGTLALRRVEAPLVALRYSRSGMVRCLKYALSCFPDERAPNRCVQSLPTFFIWATTHEDLPPGVFQRKVE